MTNLDVKQLSLLLTAPFPAEAVHWKPLSVKGNRALAAAYLDARAVMQRFDSVFGAGGWQDSYQVLPSGSESGRNGYRLSLVPNAAEEWTTMEADPFTQAVVLLSELLAEGKPARVQMERNGLRGEMIIGPIAEDLRGPTAQGCAVEPAAAATGQRLSMPGRMFSPTEEAIMATMTKDWQTKVEISDACRMPMSSQFCALLTNLVDREFLDSGHKGYRLI